MAHHWLDATHVTFGVLTAGFAIGASGFCMPEKRCMKLGGPRAGSPG